MSFVEIQPFEDTLFFEYTGTPQIISCVVLLNKSPSSTKILYKISSNIEQNLIVIPKYGILDPHEQRKVKIYLRAAILKDSSTIKKAKIAIQTVEFYPFTMENLQDQGSNFSEAFFENYISQSNSKQQKELRIIVSEMPSPRPSAKDLGKIQNNSSLVMISPEIKTSFKSSQIENIQMASPERNLKLSNYLEFVKEGTYEFTPKNKFQNDDIYEDKLEKIRLPSEKKEEKPFNQHESPQNFTFYNLEDQSRNSAPKKNKNQTISILTKNGKNNFSEKTSPVKKKNHEKYTPLKFIENDVNSVISPEGKLKVSNKLEYSMDNNNFRATPLEGTYHSDGNWDFETKNGKKQVQKLFYEDYFYEKTTKTQLSQFSEQQTLKKSPKIEKPLDFESDKMKIPLDSELYVRSAVSFGKRISHREEVFENTRKKIFEPMKRQSDANKKLWFRDYEGVLDQSMNSKNNGSKHLRKPTNEIIHINDQFILATTPYKEKITAPQVLETPKMRDEVLKFNDTASSWEESKEPHVETEKKKHFNSFGKSEDAAFLIDRRKLEEIPILESFGRKEEFPYEKKITTADPPPQMTPSSKVTYKEESGLSLWHVIVERNFNLCELTLISLIFLLLGFLLSRN